MDKEPQLVAEAETLRATESRLLIKAGSEAEEAYVEALGDEPPWSLVGVWPAWWLVWSVW